jgi:hypothetical protein
VVEPTKKYPAAADISGHWAEQYIIKLIEKGYVEGYEDGTIRPNAVLTRAEITVIFVKMKGLKTVNNPEVKFKDDDNIPAWAKPYVYAAYKAGIIEGYDDKTFRASNILTRAEIATMVVRSSGYKESTAKLGFSDLKSIPKWALGYITTAYDLKLINGYKNNTFVPNGKVTRAEAFTIIAKSLDINK